MRQRTGDILGIKTLVDIDRDVDALHDLGRTTGKPPTPSGIRRRAAVLAGTAAHGRAAPMTAKVLRSALILALVLSTAALALLLVSLWRSEPAKPPVVALGAPQDAALGEFTPLDPPRPAPPLAFAERGGETRELADFRGHWLLVNLWATWCAPCVREMPSLDRLQATLGERIRVLAISEDRKGTEVVEPFLGKLDLTAMTIYLDPAAHAQQAFGVRGLPTS